MLDTVLAFLMFFFSLFIALWHLNPATIPAECRSWNRVSGVWFALGIMKALGILVSLYFLIKFAHNSA